MRFNNGGYNGAKINNGRLPQKFASQSQTKQRLQSLLTRYTSLGKEALTHEEYVEAERNFQYAEHYVRQLNAIDRNLENCKSLPVNSESNVLERDTEQLPNQRVEWSSEHRGGVYSDRHEHSSTSSMRQSSDYKNFRKKSSGATEHAPLKMTDSDSTQPSNSEHSVLEELEHFDFPIATQPLSASAPVEVSEVVDGEPPKKRRNQIRRKVSAILPAETVTPRLDKKRRISRKSDETQ
jgi:hypothetical protein